MISRGNQKNIGSNDRLTLDLASSVSTPAWDFTDDSYKDEREGNGYLISKEYVKLSNTEQLRFGSERGKDCITFKCHSVVIMVHKRYFHVGKISCSNPGMHSGKKKEINTCSV